MATIRLSQIVLKDKTPGPVSNRGRPVDGWDSTISCSTVAGYEAGSKWANYTDNSNNPGWYTMLYGCLAEASETNHCVSGDISDGLGWVAHTCLTEDVSDTATGDPTYRSAYWNGESQPFWVMSTCTTGSGLGTKDVSGCGQVALPCASMTDHQWGWFWVGGVCPCKDVTFLDDVSAVWTGADMTALGVLAGNVHLCWTGGSALLTSQDYSSTVDDTIPTTNYEPCGYALRASA
jgi:hypothetical protein